MAVSIVFIHNTLPHQHHNELGEVSHAEEVSEATSLLEFLQLGFHLDIGSDHLANFEKAERVSFSLPFFIEFVANSQFDLVPIDKVKPTAFIHIKSAALTHHYWHEISFRGPPTA